MLGEKITLKKVISTVKAGAGICWLGKKLRERSAKEEIGRKKVEEEVRKATREIGNCAGVEVSGGDC